MTQRTYHALCAIAMKSPHRSVRWSPPRGAATSRSPDEDTADAFEVFSENWDSVLFFLQVGTQWNTIGGMERVHWLGLNYAGVETRMPKSKKKRKKLWDDLQIMEATALEVLNSQRD